MEKKFVINRVDLGQRVIGFEIFNPSMNGGEILGYTPKQMAEAVKAGDALGLVLDDTGAMVPDKAKGFPAIMVKTGVGTLTNPDPCAMANIIYTAYGKQEENFKVISSRFGRQVYCPDKIKALLDLGAINGVLLAGDKLVGAWEMDKPMQKALAGTKEKQK